MVWLIKKIQKFGPRRVHVLGRTYEISEDVFNPKYYYTSKFMAEHLNINPEDNVLDIGTGSGIQAITAGQTASQVIAVDINPRAVQSAGKNVRINRLEDTVSVIEGDLFSALDKQNQFSVILFTPPYLEGETKTVFDHALFDNNKQLVSRFFTEAKDYIKPDGYIQMIYSSIAGHEQVLEISEKFGWKHTLTAKEKTFTETFFIYKFTLN